MSRTKWLFCAVVGFGLIAAPCAGLASASDTEATKANPVDRTQTTDASTTSPTAPQPAGAVPSTAVPPSAVPPSTVPPSTVPPSTGSSPETAQPVKAFSLENIHISSSLVPQEGQETDAVLQVGSKYPVIFSGFIKVDALWSDHTLDSNDAPRFAVPEPNDEDDEFFDMMIEHSRLNADWDGPEVLYGGKVDAFLSLDFFTLNQDDVTTKYNNSRIRVRELYVNMKFDTWSFLAGQAWDVFSPLNPTTLNTNGNLWFGGNSGFRRPQFRLEKWFEVTDEQRLNMQFSVNAPIGVADPNGSNFNTGEDSGKPAFEALIDYSFAFLAEDPMVIGASGLLGEDEADGIDGSIQQSAFGVHVNLPITDMIGLRGEWAHGENTQSYLFGGAFDATGEEIETNAGWGQLSVTPVEELEFNLIVGQERLYQIAAGDRERNTVYAANVIWALAESIKVGAEYERMETDYSGTTDESANIGWLSVIFDF